MTTPPIHAADGLDAELEVVEALADRAMAPWRGRLSQEEHARVRAAVVEALATHPSASRLVAELARPPVVEASGEVSDEDAEAAAARTAQERDGSGTR